MTNERDNFVDKHRLNDTMTDWLVNMVGAVVAALIGYTYMKGGDPLIADRIVRHFVARNPNLFSRRKMRP